MHTITPAQRKLIHVLMSLVCLVFFTGMALKSFWVGQTWGGTDGQFTLISGRGIYKHASVAGVLPLAYSSTRTKPTIRAVESAIWGFHRTKSVTPNASAPSGKITFVTIEVPVWPALLLLLIMLVYFLSVRPEDAAACPVGADAKQG